MADKNNSPKKVFNPLLNVSVTGATIDEFTQNALLCPVPEPEPAILEQIPLNNPADTESTENIPLGESQQFNQPSVPSPFFNQYHQPTSYQDNQFSNSYNNNNPIGLYPTEPDSNLNSSNSSGLLSSFTSILSFSGQKKKDPIEDKPVFVPSAVEQLLSSPGEANINPVPLFNPNQTNFVPSVSPGLTPSAKPASTPLGPPPSSTGNGSNTYRRQIQKKLTYAPIPGFSSNQLQSNPIQPQIKNPNVPNPPISIFQPDQTPPSGNKSPIEIINPSPIPPQPPRFQQNQTPPTFSAFTLNNPISSSKQPEGSTSTSFNTIPSSIAELNTWTPPSPSKTPTSFNSPSPQLVSWNQTSVGIPSTYWNPSPSNPSISWNNPTPDGAPPTSWNPISSVETKTTEANPITFFNPIDIPQPFLPPVQEVKSSYLIPTQTETRHSNFLLPSSDLSEVQSLDANPSSYFSGFVMSNTTNDKKPTIPATINSTTSTMKSVTSMDNSTADAAAKPNAPPYRTVYHHWFHKKEIEGRVIWTPFSMVDSLALEAAFVSTDIHPEHMVATDGGRYDVNILRRQRSAVYWEGTPTEVRRCSWFFKGNNDGRFTPYEENIATKLEEEYKAAYEVNQWHRKVDLPSGETVVFHAPDVLVLFPQAAAADVWNNTPSTAVRPRVVKRGMDEFDIDEGEPTKIDHLLFLVHGIGSVCDLKFRSVEEVVDDFRSISLQLVQSHYKTSCEQGIANRIEVLPVSWHNQLHSEDTGIDKKLKSITLESIPKLRDFTNDTLLDILFYTSPIYCQTIIATVGVELNRIYDLFKSRNPGFKGSISLGGHSLGSLILFDILCHQHAPEKDDEKTGDGSDEDQVPPLKSVKKPPPHQRRLSRRISYMMGKVGTGQPQITYPHLNFHPIAFFALGSPIGMFVTVRGLESLGEQFALPTCPGFFNIFHPYDPVAYRIESLINSELGNVRPVLIPHHKGRKRMHLELKETMARVGADLKQRIMDSMKNTWNSVYQFTMFHRQDTRSLEAEVDKVLEEQLIGEDVPETEESSETDLPVGILNNGRRIDYVLQEAPFEFFNEYIFALTSHVCYWESEDTMLLILKEIYSSMGISTDNKIPQQTMSIERSTPSSSPSSSGSGVPRSLQMADPLRPLVYSPIQSPPPSSGFIRKT